MRSHYRMKIFQTVLLLSLTAWLSINGGAQQERSVAGATTKEEPPKAGLRVLKVLGNPAAEAGLQTMDVVSRYGNYQIVDAASYFAAREAYEKFPQSKVEIVYWHNRERVATWVTPGRLNIEFNEYGAVAYQLGALIKSLDIQLTLPAYWVDSTTGKSPLPPRERLIAEIKAAIDKAEMEGSLTPAQILVARIKAIPEDAPAGELEKQSQLLTELISKQPSGFINYLGYEVFFQNKRYRPAVACFKRELENDPENVSVRLNLGVAYYKLRMFAEADAAADYGLKEGLSGYGQGVAFQIKANAALGRRDFVAALEFAEKAFAAIPSSSYSMSLWQFAAAQTGDLQKFYEVVGATEKALPKDYENLRGRTDAIEAYILFKNNQPEKARALTVKWAGTGKMNSNPRYWEQYPSGEDILKVWQQLVSQN